MRLLLDTHVALWAITGDARLPETIQALIADPANSISVSAASVWEIAIKHALGRGGPGAMPIGGAQASAYFRASGYGLLSVSADHAAAVETLPPVHADPFDRLLVAQAIDCGARLLTGDRQLPAYSALVTLVRPSPPPSA